ncbi:KedN5 family methylcobalamin-dependent radical SAM C-methyltransferase [Roseibium sp. AS2]|uniref:KedN5 family methylcobalamin-dependent radical SAM C-methyltransferase n=1 Tax=Roseibium sp. AS2 TaxID=3135781 RepID=UPI00316BC97E
MPEQTAIGRKRLACLVQQGVWDMPVETMPLAMGYLKAMVDADDLLGREVDVRIANFGGGATLQQMVRRLFSGPMPDILAFSVFGWNIQSFGRLAETFKQINPSGWVIFGGPHVAHQAERVLGRWRGVDVVVNGEGEFVFCDLLRACVAGGRVTELDSIDGISFAAGDGTVHTTRPRDRIGTLDRIPSPFLSGAIEMKDAAGRFRYDAALMESNRGCPYACSFCYWGGAIGQKVRAFSRERLKAELDFFGWHGIESLVLCDANFGMRAADLVFIEDIIQARETHGFPRHLITSWSKNKSETFFEAVHLVKSSGLCSTFTLALQTLDEDTLQHMGRKNMRINQWKGAVDRLDALGVDSYAELIWGAPGETYDGFIEGYDRLAEQVSCIAVYPLLLLPNSHYADNRAAYGLVTLRTLEDDFERVLSHDAMTIDDNRKMMRFLFWARILSENSVFRNIWSPLLKLAGVSQSQVLLALDTWIDAQTDRISGLLRAVRDQMADSLDASRYTAGLRIFYTEAGVLDMLLAWWTQSIRPMVPAPHADLLDDIFAYDLATRPIYDDLERPDWRLQQEPAVETVHGECFYVIDCQEICCDVPELVRRIKSGERNLSRGVRTAGGLYFRTGFQRCFANQEFAPRYIGKTRAMVEAANRSRSQTLSPGHPGAGTSSGKPGTIEETSTRTNRVSHA